MKRFLFVFLLFQSLFADYRFEGIYSDDGDRRFFLMAYYLPYNPAILAPPEFARRSEQWWPNATFYPLDFLARPDPRQPCDFIWIDCKDGEQELLEHYGPLVHKASVVYTTTHLEDGGGSYNALKLFLEALGYKLLSHWFWEGKGGHAIYVKAELIDTAMRTLNFPTINTWDSYPMPLDLRPFLKKAQNKSDGHSYGGIDYIYMINLDERPDKFRRTAFELQLYGIDPYRFSAVNGWHLTQAALDQLGVRFYPGMLTEKLLGYRFISVGDRAFTSIDFLKENGQPYFTVGMSRGAVGIVLSHLSILQDALDSGFQTVWVMEDDVEVVSDPRRIPEFIQELDARDPGWDILFTDTDTKATDGRHVPCRALAARPNFRAEPISRFFERFYTLSENLSRVGMRYGAYSMIVRRSGMEKIIAYYKNFHIYLPYDIDYWLIPDLKMYSANYDIVSHKTGSPSDNSFPNYLDQ